MSYLAWRWGVITVLMYGIRAPWPGLTTYPGPNCCGQEPQCPVPGSVCIHSLWPKTSGHHRPPRGTNPRGESLGCSSHWAGYCRPARGAHPDDSKTFKQLPRTSIYPREQHFFLNQEVKGKLRNKLALGFKYHNAGKGNFK